MPDPNFTQHARRKGFKGPLMPAVVTRCGKSRSALIAQDGERELIMIATVSMLTMKPCVGEWRLQPDDYVQRPGDPPAPPYVVPEFDDEPF